MQADPKGVLTGIHFLDGDHACCEGALAAGARFAAGYPITPSTEVVERFSTRIPTIGGIFILRRKYPDMPRPYRAFGYPVLPALYIVLGLSFCGLLIFFKPQFTWPGLIIVLIGIPIYFLIKKSSQKTDGATAD